MSIRLVLVFSAVTLAASLPLSSQEDPTPADVVTLEINYINLNNAEVMKMVNGLKGLKREAVVESLGEPSTTKESDAGRLEEYFLISGELTAYGVKILIDQEGKAADVIGFQDDALSGQVSSKMNMVEKWALRDEPLERPVDIAAYYSRQSIVNSYYMLQAIFESVPINEKSKPLYFEIFAGEMIAMKRQMAALVRVCRNHSVNLGADVPRHAIICYEMYTGILDHFITFLSDQDPDRATEVKEQVLELLRLINQVPRQAVPKPQDGLVP